MINLKKNLILKYINIYPGITLARLMVLTDLSKPSICNYIKDLENENLIKKYYGETNKANKYVIHPTKLGKDIYINEKINFLLKNKIIKESIAAAPCICDGCIYYKERLSDLCESIKCDNNKIFILNK